MKPKVLITDPVHQLLIDGLTAMGYDVDYQPETSYQQVLAIIDAYNGLIINSKVPANVQLMDAGVRLKFIARLGSGLDVIDTVYAKGKGIVCFNSPEGNCNAVAEHAVGMLLSLLNNMPRATEAVKQHRWLREENRGTELGTLTVGLIGYGYTGKAMAKVLSGFGCKVLVYDKYVSGFAAGHVHEVDMQSIFNEADVLSLHVQLTNETRYLVDRNFLSRFKKPLYVVNTSRGSVINTPELLDAIDAGNVIAAALDVLENEHPGSFTTSERESYDELVNHPAVLVTPHIAGWTHQSKEKIAKVMLDKIEKLLK